VDYPAGANPADFLPEGQGTPLFSFWLPVSGHYEVKLTVINDIGVASGDTAASRVAFDVSPPAELHVALTWDDPTNDQDLHVTRVGAATDLLCSSNNDCYFGQKQPVWFTSSEAGIGPNPRLDIDDTHGSGPENVNIDTPEPATYRVYVHYYAGASADDDGLATQNTVKIYLNGVLRGEFDRTLQQRGDLWAVADITWAADGNHTVTPYPSNQAGQIGAMDFMDFCESNHAFSPN
jgi:hypothetical protein